MLKKYLKKIDINPKKKILIIILFFIYLKDKKKSLNIYKYINKTYE